MRRTIITIAILGILLVPTFAGAVSWIPLVPCGTSADGQVPCTPCHLFEAVHNIFDLVLIGMTGPIAAFMIVIAGGMMLLGGGKPALYSQGTTMLKNTLIGVAIILLAWVVTNTLIKSLITTGQGNAWYQFSCPDFLDQPEDAPPAAPVPAQGSPERPAPVLAQASAAACTPEFLATKYRVPFHQPSEYRAPPNTNNSLNSPSLNTLISCILQDEVVKAMYNPASLFSYEVNTPLCNLTRGIRDCGPACQHSGNSCHTGGVNGNQGAMAVDFNSNFRPITYIKTSRTVVSANDSLCTTPETKGQCRRASGEEGLFDELHRAAVKYNCNWKLLNFEGDHTHISTTDCDKDGPNGSTRLLKGRPAPVP